MHLIIPHASALGEACAHTLGDLALPRLSRLLGLMKPLTPSLGGNELSFDTPFDLALAQLRGEPSPVPTAAWLARAQGLDGSRAWALLTPLHLSVGSDQITALPPDGIGEAESRVYFDSLAELWPEAEGWASHWLAPALWLIAHESLAKLASASLDRVLMRNVDPWMPEARRLRTLQNEVQMLLHTSPLNAAREAKGQMPVNSVWISGCGASAGGELPAEVRIDERLREPLLAGDWAAWAEAWRALDAELPLNANETFQLTLCGERSAQTWALPERSGLAKLWQQIAPPQANTARILEAL